MSGEPRCDDCGTGLGEVHPDRTGDLLCRRCFVKRYPAEVVDAEEPSVAVLANGNGPASASDLHARLEAARRDIVPGHGGWFRTGRRCPLPKG